MEWSIWFLFVIWLSLTFIVSGLFFKEANPTIIFICSVSSASAFFFLLKIIEFLYQNPIYILVWSSVFSLWGFLWASHFSSMLHDFRKRFTHLKVQVDPGSNHFGSFRMISQKKENGIVMVTCEEDIANESENAEKVPVRKYIGSKKRGFANGKGVLFRKDGTKLFEGNFKRGAIIDGTIFYQDGVTKKISGNFSLKNGRFTQQSKLTGKEYYVEMKDEKIV